MNDFYKDFETLCSEYSNGTIDAYNRGLITMNEAIATILDYKRQAVIDRMKAERKANRPKGTRQQVFKKGVDIPKSVRNKTYYNMRKYNLCSYDAFEAALRDTPSAWLPGSLFADWYNSNLSKYLA